MGEEVKSLLHKAKIQPFFYVISAAVVYFAFVVLKPYLATVVLAVMTAIIFRPVYDFLHKKLGNRVKLASFLTVIVVFLTLLVPSVFVITMSVRQVIQFSKDVRDFTKSSDLEIGDVVERANTILDKVPYGDYSVTEADIYNAVDTNSKAVGKAAVGWLVSIGSNSVEIPTHFVTYIILLFGLFPAQAKLLDLIGKISPLDDRIDQIYIKRVIEMAKSMVKGTFLISMVQAGLSALFLWIAGVPYVLFWFLFLSFFGIIPVFGMSVVVVPIGLVLIALGNVWQGVFLIVTNILIVGQIDNVIRPKLVSKEAEMPPALLLLGVLGGIKVFGPLGLIYGPVIMILLVTTVDVYMRFYRK